MVCRLMIYHVFVVYEIIISCLKLCLDIGDNLTTLLETVVVSNENVQEPTKMFGESNIVL